MRLHALVLLLVVALPSLQAQEPPWVELKVKEKSGFLGIGPPRFILLYLSNQQRQLPLTSVNVNAGPYYYFNVRPTREWKLDADFVRTDLPKLSLSQGEQKFAIVWTGELLSDADGTSILVGFSKDLRIHESFYAQFQMGEALSQMEFRVPEELWPGYDTLTDLLRQIEQLKGEQRHRDVITFYNRLLANAALQIFPRYQEVRAERTRAFQHYLAQSLAAFESVRTSTDPDLKQRIARLDQLKPSFLFVSDSLVNSALRVGISEPGVLAIVEQAKEAYVAASSARDSLQRALDDQLIRWIVQGSTSGSSGYLYQYMVESLAYAFASIDFRDTVSRRLTVRLPVELQTRLAKYNLTESYDTFIRVCAERYSNGLPLFPSEFLPNLQKDSATLPLPYYSVLKAVNDYLYGHHASALREIRNVLMHSYDWELSSRFDALRVLINTRELNVSPDVLRLLQEAEQAEARGDTQAALERYLQATIIAPHFGHAAFALGKYYARTGDPIRAQTFFEQAFRADSLYLSAYRESYTLYFRSANYKPMIDVLTRALRGGNDFWEIHFNLGLAFMGDGDAARAIQHFERALELSPFSYTTNIRLGLVYQDIRNYQKARDYFNRAIAIDPVRQEAIDFLTKLNELQRSGR